MKTGETTLKDLARELKIAPSTVSRALKNHPEISAKTKLAVSKLAKKLNYRPNYVAQSLRKSRTNTIGVIVPKIVHFFFSTIIDGIEEVAYKNGYNILLCQSNETYQKEITDTQVLYNSRVDGMLVSFSKETTNFEHFEDLQQKGIPLVFFDRKYGGTPVNQVLVNDYSGAKKAVQHLIDQGFKRIAHLAGLQGLALGDDRLRGYKAALHSNNRAFEEDLVKFDPQHLDFESGYTKTIEFLDMKNPPDALFAHQDLNAIGAMKAAKERGLRIPEDFGVVGFSNWQMSSYIDPPLTTVSQNGHKMGVEAATLLIEQIKHKDSKEEKPYEFKMRILETELIVRGSSVRQIKDVS